MQAFEFNATEKLMPVSSRGIAYDSIDLTAPWKARGQPVIFLHGIGANRHTWAEWLDPLAARHPIIRCELRGFGESASLPENQPLLDVILADVLELMPSNETVHLVGESAGGTFMLALALRYPERVASVTMSNAAVVGRQVGQLDRWRPLFAQGTEAWNDHMMQNRFAPGSIDEPALKWYREQQGLSKPESVLAIADLLASMDLRDDLPQLKPPLLLLMPDSSPFIALSMYDNLHRWLPDAQMHVFKGVRHGLPYSHGRECGRLLADFIDAHEA